MSSLFSCFWKNKKKGDYYDQQENDRRRRLSRENHEVMYVETGEFVDKSPGNQLQFNGNVRNVYRTETESNYQTPQYERLYRSDENRQSRSYPVSPERRSVIRAHSFEQRPSFERPRFISKRDSKDSRNLTVYATNVNSVSPRFGKTTDHSDDSFPLDIPTNNVTRKSTITHGMDVDYEKETMVPTESQICEAEKPGEQYYGPGTSRDNPEPLTVPKDNNKLISGNKRHSMLRRSETNTENFSPRISMTENQNYSFTDNTEPQVKTVLRMIPRNSTRKFALGNTVKPMIYRVEDNPRSPLSARKYVQQMPIKVKKQHHILTTEDGKVLRPLTSENIKTLSVSKGNEPVRLSIIRPLEQVENFPLVQGRETIVAAPMIGSGGGKVKRGGKPQKNKSILRKGAGGYRGAPPVDDYDDYGYEGNDYYEEADMYPFTPMDDSYSYNSRGYYNDGYGYQDADMGRYGRGPGMSRGGRQARQQIYAAQMPDIALQNISVDTGKNPSFKKTSKPSKTLDSDSCIDKDYYMKTDKSENKEQLTKEHKVKLVSSAQQTDIRNELDFICFSPDKCFNTVDAPDDPNSKLRWRIIIKRGDEE